MSDLIPDATFAAARAYCVAKFNYQPEHYVSPEAHERHIRNDAESTAEEEPFAAAIAAAAPILLAAGRRQAADAILDAFDAMKGRIKTKTTDKKVAACQMVGLSMAALKVIEMADGWGAPAEPVEEADR